MDKDDAIRDAIIFLDASKFEKVVKINKLRQEITEINKHIKALGKLREKAKNKGVYKDAPVGKFGTYNDKIVVKVKEGKDQDYNNWIEAEGQLVSKSTYKELFHEFGYNFGGEGAQFRLPDMREH